MNVTGPSFGVAEVPNRGRGKVPGHLAVVLDGNRRWAERNRVPVVDAYRAGAVKVRELLCWCEEFGVWYVTVWALSPDNLGRPSVTVTGLVETIAVGLREMAAERRWRIRVIGDLDRLPAEQAAVLRAVQRDTDGVQGITLNAAVAYGGRQEIVRAVAAIARDAAHGVLRGPVTEGVIERYLFTTGQPDVDLVIRTSGEQRLSGFMPWQASHAEYHFTPVCWPDFDRRHFAQALAEFGHRHRRSGL
ncbi:polyprenyl diphosphate synthase [Streptomyces spectabilis]|uniref:Isoprenyl transferase n=1 Tax=Streptomyces spectabilis TaxID=68270 RepID=A0A7W8F007_STRST|nr:polyprenyl diphosphate synthase [Streptomyces spectabilis]MBB5109948.1 short-chain Z-isoprenyl diphosphate synthase [Streptomyces spectabilis]